MWCVVLELMRTLLMCLLTVAFGQASGDNVSVPPGAVGTSITTPCTRGGSAAASAAFALAIVSGEVPVEPAGEDAPAATDAVSVPRTIGASVAWTR